jgi:hypothetical protein
MQLTDVLSRIDSILTGAPFGYVVAKEPFGFGRQPATALHRTYCLSTQDPREVGGYLGYVQNEIVPVSIRIARKVQRDAVAAHRALLTDVSSLQAAIARDGVDGDYNADVETWRVEEPGPTDDYVIAELIALADYERGL